jgi:hypothetical protein
MFASYSQSHHQLIQIEQGDDKTQSFGRREEANEESKDSQLSFGSEQQQERPEIDMDYVPGQRQRAGPTKNGKNDDTRYSLDSLSSIKSGEQLRIARYSDAEPSENELEFMSQRSTLDENYTQIGAQIVTLLRVLTQHSSLSQSTSTLQSTLTALIDQPTPDSEDDDDLAFEPMDDFGQLIRQNDCHLCCRESIKMLTHYKFATVSAKTDQD